MYKKTIYYLLFSVVTSLCCTTGLTAQETPQIWKKYIGEINDSEVPDLPNYSYAGYKLGEEAIPDSNAPVYDVTDYGAIANDYLSDVAAIKAAITAAENSGGGVVFFPKGEFIVNATAGNDASIVIGGSHIVLKGSGSGQGGTVITMQNVMAQEPGMTGEWECNPMFQFVTPENASAPANLTADSDKGTNYVTVDDVSVLNGYKYVRLYMAPNTAANNLYLDGKTPLNSIWTSINQTGVEAKEFHEIDHITGNKVYFKDEFINDIKFAHGWTIEGWNMIEESGFEDIHFKAKFRGPFVHHKNYEHDAGWRVIRLTNTAHSWVRRSRFSNVSLIASTVDCYALSFVELLLDGNRGHSTVDIAKASRTLAGLIWDNTNNGQFHGINMSGATTGSVAWRVESIYGRGIDFHGSFPRSNLFDVYQEYNVVGNGGSTAYLPNHLGGLTLWNLSKEGPAVTDYDFWMFCNYCAAVVANPIIVGFHRTETTFLQDNIKYEESNGTKVFPESLYEAQLEHRLDTKPAWIDAAILEFEELKEQWYPSVGESDYTETINNLVLNGWGSETYTGDNGFVWNVNAKGVTDYIDASKEVYFQKGVTGITSNSISGGINSFSIECKNLWDITEERKVELLVNGEIVGAMQHTGERTYIFKVNDINIEGDVVIAIRNASTPEPGQDFRKLAIAFDNINWTRNTSLPIADKNYVKASLYPNPSDNGIYTLTVKELAIAKIHDLQGRFIKQSIPLNTGDNTLDISNVDTGIYLLTLTTNSGVTTSLKLIRN